MNVGIFDYIVNIECKVFNEFSDEYLSRLFVNPLTNKLLKLT